MRLGFDLDGTVADLHSALALEARRLFPGIDPAAVPTSAAPGAGPASEDTGDRDDSAGEERHVSFGSLSSRQQSEIWNAVCDRENFWETLDEIEPGALARLYALVREHRWELIFLTSRPETRGDTAQSQSHRWLSKHGFREPSVFVVHGSRGKIAASLALDVLVDDRPENCLDVAIDSSARDSGLARRPGERARQRPSTRDRLGRLDARVPRHPGIAGSSGLQSTQHGRTAQAAARPEAAGGASEAGWTHVAIAGGHAVGRLIR